MRSLKAFCISWGYPGVFSKTEPSIATVQSHSNPAKSTMEPMIVAATRADRSTTHSHTSRTAVASLMSRSTPYDFLIRPRVLLRLGSSSSTHPLRYHAGNPCFSSSLPPKPRMTFCFLRESRAMRAISPMYSPETIFSVSPSPLFGDPASTASSHSLWMCCSTFFVGESKLPHSMLMHIVASLSAPGYFSMYFVMRPTFSQYATLKPVPMITPRVARLSLNSSVTSVPTVSLITAVTPICTPLFLSSTASRSQTSLPTTPFVLKLFVQRTRTPEFSECFFIGKENVNPKGGFFTEVPLMKSLTLCAMNPNRPSAVPPTTCSIGILNFADLVSTTFESLSVSLRTRKFVPPKSRA
mmetsp:Transcript_465/g.889  ORF Transcript_465/g.889 Transcript_465/m.889 type:complete len:354 (+) Transcript_465:416-1477(+)